VTELPVVSGRDVIRALERLGYYIRRQKGSHLRLYHLTRPPVTVTTAKVIKKATLKSILRTAGLDVAEFASLLKG
jgi:predicted RNA binding protein YcfA (HicA-like mRNA interferase family)